MIERNAQAARQRIDEIDGREHKALQAEMARVWGPIQSEAVDQFRVFIIAQLPAIIVFLPRSVEMLEVEVGSEIGVLEKSVGGGARQPAEHRGFRRVVIDPVDQVGMKAE